MSASPKFAAATAHVDEAAIQPLPRSRKVYLQGSRPELRVPVRELSWRMDGSDVHLQFRLQRGSFATAVLHELISNAFIADTPEADV